ncbi:MFS transporter [Nostocoides japonicum]|nr:MFS transporter [Tetrasphaera japonica]
MKRLIVVLIGGMLLDGYILGIVGPVNETMTADLAITPAVEGLIAAAALIGIGVGSPIGGWAGDKWGRKPLFMVDIALFSVASAMQFFVHSAALLLVVRLLMGIAIGMEYSVGWPMLAEFAPVRIRGALLAATNIAWYGGFLLAYILGTIWITQTHLSWKFILGTSTFLAVALLLGRLGMPESPRWLWNQGRKDEAIAIVNKYMDPPEFSDMEHSEVRKGTFSQLFATKQARRATVFVSGFWFCVVAPYFAIATFAVTVLKQYGMDGPAGSIGLSALALAGVITCAYLVDKVGRRTLAVPSSWLAFIMLALIGFWTGAPAMIVLVLFFGYSFVNGVGGTLTGIFPGEMFPTEIRGVGTGFAAAISRVGAAAGTFLLPIAMVSLGASVSMLIAAGVALVGALLAQFLAPETKGLSLAEAAKNFSH